MLAVFWQNEIGAKAMSIMLVELTIGALIRWYIFRRVIILYKVHCIWSGKKIKILNFNDW